MLSNNNNTQEAALPILPLTTHPHRRRKGGAGGPAPPGPPNMFLEEAEPLNVIGLILRCLVNYKLLPNVLKGFALCQPPQYLCLSYAYDPV